MKKFWIASLVCGSLFVGSMSADAATYNVSFDGSQFDVLADITTDPGNNVTVITGTVNGVGITGLGSDVTNTYWYYDQQFSGASPYVTNNGILFAVGALLYNLYSSGPDFFLSTFADGGGFYNPGDKGLLAVTETPLPAPILLFGSVLAAVAGFFRRRGKSKNIGSYPPAGLAPA